MIAIKPVSLYIYLTDSTLSVEILPMEVISC